MIHIKTNSVATFILAVLIASGLYLGVVWLLWVGFTFLVGELWPTAPVEIAEIDYWVFLVMWLLICAVGSVFRK